MVHGLELALVPLELGDPKATGRMVDAYRRIGGRHRDRNVGLDQGWGRQGRS